MRRFLPFIMLMMAAPANADITHRISSSVQLNVQSAATQATRLGNSFSTSGSGVNTDIGGGASADNKLGGGTLFEWCLHGAPSLPTVTQPLQAKHSRISFFHRGDALVTSGPTVGEVSAFSHSRLLMLLVLPVIWQVLSMLTDL